MENIKNNSKKEIKKAKEALSLAKSQVQEKINITHKWVKTFKGYKLVKI